MVGTDMGMEVEVKESVVYLVVVVLQDGVVMEVLDQEDLVGAVVVMDGVVEVVVTTEDIVVVVVIKAAREEVGVTGEVAMVVDIEEDVDIEEATREDMVVVEVGAARWFPRDIEITASVRIRLLTNGYTYAVSLLYIDIHFI